MHLQRDLGLAIPFISHHPTEVEHLSDRVAFMYLGWIMELADRDILFSKPCHPYTKVLLSAVPLPDRNTLRDCVVLKSEVPSPINTPSGCPFGARCPIAIDLCSRERPNRVEYPVGQQVACYFPEGAGTKL